MPACSARPFLVAITTKKGKSIIFNDHCALNRVMTVYQWYMSNIEKVFSVLSGASFSTVLDLSSWYWQFFMADKSSDKIAFYTRYGTSKFTNMLFGLMNAPELFQRMVNQVVKSFPYVKVCLVQTTSLYFLNLLRNPWVTWQLFWNEWAAVSWKLNFQNSALQKEIAICWITLVRLWVFLLIPIILVSSRRRSHHQNEPRLWSYLGHAGYYRFFMKSFARISATL